MLLMNYYQATTTPTAARTGWMDRESGINRNTDASVPKINWTRRSLELVNSGYLVEMFTHDNKLITQP